MREWCRGVVCLLGSGAKQTILDAPDSPGKDHGCHADVTEPDGSLPDIGAFGGPLAAWADL